jgi:hypothetical protein
MADSTNKVVEKAATSFAGDHDRVVALSVRVDGTLDQTDPEIIGDKDFALAATKRQFAEMAVSAVDAQRRRELGLAGDTERDTSDAAIDKLRKEHEAAASAAEKQAEAVVNALTK